MIIIAPSHPQHSKRGNERSRFFKHPMSASLFLGMIPIVPRTLCDAYTAFIPHPSCVGSADRCG
jgi:hypothetical protein